jgi:tetratricopeptide (TPR) repeat protein
VGFRFYKSVKLGKGVRLNLSKTGVGISSGVPGARYSIHSSGRRTASVGIPGSGVSYRKDMRSSTRATSSRRTQAMPAAVAPAYPKAGLLAPKGDKAFVRGVTAYMQGRHADALAALEEARSFDPDNRHVAEELFAAMSLVGLERVADAVPYFEAVLSSDQAIPDSIMMKYGVAGSIGVNVTPAVMITVPFSSIAVALILAEAYQLTNQRQIAIELLESLGSQAADETIFALSLADLYAEAGQWEDVVRVTEGVLTNEDDLALNTLLFRANALYELEMTEGALALTKECLRTKKRSPDLLRSARYLRGLIHEKSGKPGMAKKEFERVYAEDASFADVAQRLGMAATAATAGHSYQTGSDSVLPPPP